MFHLAGIPTYLLVAELAVNRVLHGELPRPVAYPEKLRATAHGRWSGTARMTLAYAKANHAPAGRRTEVAGAIAVAVAQAAHAVLAARGEWVTNEKRLVERAGLREADDVIGALGSSPESLIRSVAAAEGLVESSCSAAPPLPRAGNYTAREL